MQIWLAEYNERGTWRLMWRGMWRRGSVHLASERDVEREECPLRPGLSMCRFWGLVNWFHWSVAGWSSLMNMLRLWTNLLTLLSR